MSVKSKSKIKVVFNFLFLYKSKKGSYTQVIMIRRQLQNFIQLDVTSNE